MTETKRSDSPKNPNPAESGAKELSESELKDVSGGLVYELSNPSIKSIPVNGGGGEPPQE
jgi:hypothetical protein